MAEQKKKSGLWLAVTISGIILAVVVIWAVVKKQTTEQPYIGHQHESGQPVFEPTPTSTDDVNQPRMSLNDVIDRARYWAPAYTSWQGRMAPNFALTDINGKRHKLSDYRGKDVILVFWATWCTICKAHTPHLIALQNVIGKDKLAVLAISYISPDNTTEMVKSFVEQNKRINYPVFCSDRSTVPSPYDGVMLLPSSFFIKPDGRIKLGTRGFVSLGEMKDILRAE